MYTSKSKKNLYSWLRILIRTVSIIETSCHFKTINGLGKEDYKLYGSSLFPLDLLKSCSRTSLLYCCKQSYKYPHHSLVSTLPGMNRGQPETLMQSWVDPLCSPEFCPPPAPPPPPPQPLNTEYQNCDRVEFINHHWMGSIVLRRPGGSQG